MSLGHCIPAAVRGASARSSLTPRALPSRPPHALRWITTSSRFLAPAASPPAAPEEPTRTKDMYKVVVQPSRNNKHEVAFIPLKDKTPFTHPSLFHTAKWRFEVPQEVDGIPYTHCDYEKHVAFGDTILQMILTEYMWEAYPRLSVSGMSDLLAAVRTTRILADISQQFQFPSRLLLADPLAIAALRYHSKTQANLVLGYIAGLHQQEGYLKTRQWVLKAFQRSIAEHYEKLREEEAARARPAAEVRTSEMSRLLQWLDDRRIKLSTEYESQGKPPMQTFTCWLKFSGETFEGKGETKGHARNSAATLALTYVDDVLKAELAEVEARQGGTESVTYNPHSWKLSEYCKARGLEPEISYKTDETELDFQFCTLRVEGMTDSVTARGRGKPWAKDEAAKIALQQLGVDLSSLPAPTARGVHISEFVLYCQREKLGRSFTISDDPSGDREWFVCRVEWGNRTTPMRWVRERGRGKQEAKNNACKAALDIIGLDSSHGA